jgi:hypothetical protein
MIGLKWRVVRSLRSNRPWLLRTSGRITAARVAAVIGYLLTMSLPDELNLLIDTCWRGRLPSAVLGVNGTDLTRERGAANPVLDQATTESQRAQLGYS